MATDFWKYLDPPDVLDNEQDQPWWKTVLGRLGSGPVHQPAVGGGNVPYFTSPEGQAGMVGWERALREQAYEKMGWFQEDMSPGAGVPLTSEQQLTQAAMEGTWHPPMAIPGALTEWPEGGEWFQGQQVEPESGGILEVGGELFNKLYGPFQYANWLVQGVMGRAMLEQEEALQGLGGRLDMVPFEMEFPSIVRAQALTHFGYPFIANTEKQAAKEVGAQVRAAQTARLGRELEAQREGVPGTEGMAAAERMLYERQYWRERRSQEPGKKVKAEYKAYEQEIGRDVEAAALRSLFPGMPEAYVNDATLGDTWAWMRDNIGGAAAAAYSWVRQTLAEGKEARLQRQAERRGEAEALLAGEVPLVPEIAPGDTVVEVAGGQYLPEELHPSQESYIRNTLQDIASGSVAVEQAVAEVHDPSAEFVWQMVADTANVYDLLSLYGFGVLLPWAGRKAKRTESAIRLMTEPAEDLASARALDGALADISKVDRVFEEMAAEGAVIQDALTQATWRQRAGGAVSNWTPEVIKRVGRSAKWLVDLTPIAKAHDTSSKVWGALVMLLKDMPGPEAAKLALRAWARDPAELQRAVIFMGNIPFSEAGRLTQVVLRHTIDIIEQLPSLNRAGIRWNPAQVLADIDGVINPVLAKAYGYKPLTGVSRVTLNVANAMKRAMSEIYLNPIFSPGYASRQVVSELITPLVDGVLPLSSKAWLNMVEEEWEVVGRRVTTGGAGQRAELTGVPEVMVKGQPKTRSILRSVQGENVLGEKVIGTLAGMSEAGMDWTRRGELFGWLPIGEEQRYRRQYYRWLERFMKTNWTSARVPPMSPELIRMLGGPARAADLVGTLTVQRNYAKMRQAVREYFEGVGPGDTMDLWRYVDADPGMRANMDPQVMEAYREYLRELPPGMVPEERLAAARDRVLQDIDDGEARKLAEQQQRPASTRVATDAEEADLVSEEVQTLREAAERSGDPEVVARAGEIEEQLDEIASDTADARDAAVALAVTSETPREGVWVLVDANRQAEDLRLEIRLEADLDRRKTIEAYREMVYGEVAPNPAEVSDLWRQYFYRQAERYQAAARGRLALFHQAQERLERMVGGESLEDVIGIGRRAELERRFRQVNIPPKPDKPFLPGSVLEAEYDGEFEALLEYNRALEDYARNQAWYGIHGVKSDLYGDALDILDSADRDVAELYKQAAGRVAKERDYALRESDRVYFANGGGTVGAYAARHVWEKYYSFSADEWQAAFRSATKRWNDASDDMLLMAMHGSPSELSFLARPSPGTGATRAMPAAAEVLDVARGGEALTRAQEQTIEDWILGRPDMGEARYTRERYYQDIRTKANLSGQEATMVVKAFDARARAWAVQTGRAPSDWWNQIAGVQKRRTADLPAEVLEAMAPGEVVKGAYEVLGDGRVLITFFEQADMSTAIHELAHHFITEMEILDPDGFSRVKAQAVAAGVLDSTDAIWTDEAAEWFVDSWEAYLREGIAPTPELANAFQHFKRWLTYIYHSLRGDLPALNDEMRRTFDALLREDMWTPPATELERAMRDGRPIGQMPLFLDDVPLFPDERPPQLQTGQPFVDLETGLPPQREGYVGPDGRRIYPAGSRKMVRTYQRVPFDALTTVDQVLGREVSMTLGMLGYSMDDFAEVVGKAPHQLVAEDLGAFHDQMRHQYKELMDELMAIEIDETKLVGGKLKKATLTDKKTQLDAALDEMIAKRYGAVAEDKRLYTLGEWEKPENLKLRRQRTPEERYAATAKDIRSQYRALREEWGRIQSGEVLPATTIANGGGLLHNNAKTTLSFNLPLSTCHPTFECKDCYVTKSPIGYVPSIAKAQRNLLYLLLDPVATADQVAREYRALSGVSTPFMRMLGSGDLVFDEAVTFVNRLSAKGDRPIHIFSRHHDRLQQIQGSMNAPVLKIASVDGTIFKAIDDNPAAWNLYKRNMRDRGISNAFMLTEENLEYAIPKLRELRDAGELGLILPTGGGVYKKLPADLRKFACPCDADLRTMRTSCPRCYYNEASCFMQFAGTITDKNGRIWSVAHWNEIPAWVKQSGNFTRTMPFAVALAGDQYYDEIIKGWGAIYEHIAEYEAGKIALALTAAKGKAKTITLDGLLYPGNKLQLTIVDSLDKITNAQLAMGTARTVPRELREKGFAGVAYVTREEAIETLETIANNFAEGRKAAEELTFVLGPDPVQDMANAVQAGRLLDSPEEAWNAYQKALAAWKAKTVFDPNVIAVRQRLRRRHPWYVEAWEAGRVKGGEHVWERSAKEMFGETDNSFAGAFITSDGAYLDFTDARAGGSPPVKAWIHSNVTRAMGDTKGVHTTGVLGLSRYMAETGNIRMQAGPGAARVEVMAPVSPAQKKKLAQMLADGYITWDVVDPQTGGVIAHGVARDKQGLGQLYAHTGEARAEGKFLWQTAEPRWSPEFKEWFGEGALRDAEGNPKRLYHGTVSDFDGFDIAKGRGSIDRLLGPHLSADPEIASRFAINRLAYWRDFTDNNAGRVIPVYSNAQKIKYIPQKYYGVAARPVHDQTLIAGTVADAVLNEDQDLFARWYASLGRGGDYEEGRAVWDALKRGDDVTEDIVSKVNTMARPSDERLMGREWGPGVYATNFDTYLGSNEPMGREIAERYRSGLLEEGYGLIAYTNTAPAEIEAQTMRARMGVRRRPDLGGQQGDVEFRSPAPADKTCYICLDPKTVKSIFNDAPNASDPRLLYQTAPSMHTEAWSEWFMDSKAVDEAGEPLPLYHGTSMYRRPEFDHFNPGWRTGMIWLSDAPQYASDFARDGAVYKVYARLRNPLDLRGLPVSDYDLHLQVIEHLQSLGIDTADLYTDGMIGAMEQYQLLNYWGRDLVRRLQAKGYDGIIINERWGGLVDEAQDVHSYIAFEGRQVKSAFNPNPSYSDQRMMFQMAQATRDAIDDAIPVDDVDVVYAGKDEILKNDAWLRNTWRAQEESGSKGRTIGYYRQDATGDVPAGGRITTIRNKYNIPGLDEETYAHERLHAMWFTRIPSSVKEEVNRRWRLPYPEHPEWTRAQALRLALSQFAPAYSAATLDSLASELFVWTVMDLAGRGHLGYAGLAEVLGDDIPDLFMRAARESGFKLPEFMKALQHHVDTATAVRKAMEEHNTHMLWQNAVPLYHKSERLIAAKMPNRAHAGQVLAILTKGGVKTDELESTGVLRWLANQKGMLDKDDVLDWMVENRARVNERVLGMKGSVPQPNDWVSVMTSENTDIPPPLRQEYHFMEDPSVVGADEFVIRRSYDYDPATGAVVDHDEWVLENQGLHLAASPADEGYEALMEYVANDYAAQMEYGAMEGAGGTRFAEHTQPGGTEYREYVITFEQPRRASREADRAYRALKELESVLTKKYADPRDMLGEVSSRAFMDRMSPADVEQHELLMAAYEKAEAARVLELEIEQPYTGSHYDQQNVLVHVRTKMRRDADGRRGIYIEELQSDWMQDGTDWGWVTPGDRELLASAKKELRFLRQEWLQSKRSFGLPANDFGLNELYHGGQTARGALGSESWYTRNVARLQLDALGSEEKLDEAIAAYGRWYESMDPRIDALDTLVTELSNRKPDAPFKATYDQLAFKRMLKAAVEEELDFVAWTPGRVHYDRWGSELFTWKKTEDGWAVGGKAQAGGVGGQGLTFEELAADLGRPFLDDMVPVRSIDDLRPIVADLAGGVPPRRQEKILNVLWGRMQEADSGIYMPRKEGLEYFYDVRLPSGARKAARPVKGQVTEIRLSDIPSTRWKVTYKDSTASLGTFASQHEAELFVQRQVRKRNLAPDMFTVGKIDDASVVPGIYITAEMAKQIREEGLPLFQSRVPPSMEDDITEIQRARLRQHHRMKQEGHFERPDMSAVIQARAELNRRGVQAIHEGLVRDWPQWRPIIATDEAERATMSWLDNAYVPLFNEAKAAAMRFAKMQTDEAMLDYARVRGFDTLLSMVVPYHYWFTRSAGNWLKRMTEHPSILTKWIRTQNYMKSANEEAGRRARFGGMAALPFPWEALGAPYLGDKIFINPLSWALPYDNIFNRNWDDDQEARYGLSQVYNTMQKIGMRVNPALAFAYQTGMFAKMAQSLGASPENAQRYYGPDIANEFNFQLPFTKTLRAATALMREKGYGMNDLIPPGGTVLEELPRNLANLPRGEAWDPYRVGRTTGGIAAMTPGDRDMAIVALVAQELMRRDPDQRGRVWLPGSTIAEEVRVELNLDPETLLKAQRYLSQSMQQSTFEQGVRTAGYMMGPQLAAESVGERAQIEMADEAAALRWDPVHNPDGSYEAYEEYKAAHPAMYPRATQYQLAPGEAQDTMTPGERANWLLRKWTQEELASIYDPLEDALIRERPWDTGAYGEIAGQRAEASQGIKDAYPLPAVTGDIPPVRWGMNRAEAWDAIVEDQLWEVQGHAPRKADYRNEDGTIDYDRFNADTEKYMSLLPELVPGQSGTILHGKYRGLSLREAYEQWSRREHSALEALMWTYGKEVRNAAFAELDRTGDWETTVGAVPAMDAVELIDAVRAAYPERAWTVDFLRREYEGVRFQPLELAYQTPEGQAMARFYDLLDQVPHTADVRKSEIIEYLLAEWRLQKAREAAEQ